MSRRSKWVLAVGAVVAVALIAWPVYAYSGRTAADCKTMCKMMDDSKLTLAKAIETAERHSKGKALAAYCELEEGALEIKVYCSVGEKILGVEINSKTGEVAGTEEAKALPPGEEKAEGHKAHTEKKETEKEKHEEQE